MPKQSTKPFSHNHLDLVKAAAWAWYQHGSSSQGKPIIIRDFDAAPFQRTPRPTRYKLEAMKNNNNSTEVEGSIPTNNSLLDSYEIESISKRLDQLIESNGIKFYREVLRIDADADDNQPEKKRSSTRLKGFLQRRAVVCGRNHDVEETALRLKNQVAAKKVNGEQRAAGVR
ncbi:hypothetical protein V6N13_067788 [Hibiscus sabdariffa]|uniref:Uncharacterized protein n=1 Tax=Hibiscus sabdariffa TaxID=183260 RepID=A0ABR2DUG7_9ROSI